MKKPAYVGMDLRKKVMYEFRYNYLKPKYGSEEKLC